MFYRLSRSRSFNALLVFSILAAILVVPTTAEAGILGSVLSAVRPFAKFAKIAGAVAGATLCSAFLPPLGMIAGGIGGWIVGGIVTGYGTGSLSNLATLATLGGAVAGAMALASFGPLGYVAGALAGGFLGRTAMKLLHTADREATGGILFLNNNNNNSGSSTVVGGAPALAPEIPRAHDQVIAPAPISEGTGQATTITTQDEIREAEARYRNAYNDYIAATRNNKASEIKKAHEKYIAAFEAYKKLTGEEPEK
jgi:hypothetical protein